MSEAAAVAQDLREKLGPGRLVLVVGPSGAGK
ncbi:MAG: phosphonate metabolism protein/1,5-bisphosphokinase (PRPP-forming) PhnN, partial [Bradyrhizobium sp.]